MQLDKTPLEICSKEWRDAVNVAHFRSILNSYKINICHSQYSRCAGSLQDLIHKGYCYIYPDTDLLAQVQAKSQGLPCLQQQENTENTHLTLSRIADPGLIVSIINLLESLSIFKSASAYFGSPDITVSDFYYMSVRRYVPNLHSEMDGAALWHRDSMGRTLKVFVPLSSTGNSISTQLCTYSNVTSPIPQMWEMLRANPDLSYSQRISLTNLITYYFSHNCYQSSSSGTGVFVFDTNTFHRGAYMSHEGLPGDSRSHLQCTISYNPTLQLYSLLPGHGIQQLENPVNLSLSILGPDLASILSTKQFTFS